MVSTSYDSCQAFVLIAQGTPTDAGRLSNVTGTGMLSFVLNIISAYDPWLATTLHNHAPAKVIAVAQLYEGRKRGPGGVPQLAIRVACLRQAVAEAFRRGVEAVMVQQLERPVMRLGNISLTLERLISVDHSWVGATTLPQIIAAGRDDDDPPAAIAIEFASPFHARLIDGGGRRIVPPLPTPEVVFGSMQQRLLAVIADAPLAGIDSHHLERAIVRTSVVDYNIAAVRYVIKANTDPAVPVEERVRPGLRGQVTFYCEGGREDRALLHTLARIAFFTGAGAHTALGMGLVRPTLPRQLGTWMFARTDLVGEVPLLMRRGDPTPGRPGGLDDSDDTEA